MRFAPMALILWIFLLTASSQPQTAEAPQLIQDVRVFDGESVLEHRSVLIENGKIFQIGDASLKAQVQRSSMAVRKPCCRDSLTLTCTCRTKWKMQRTRRLSSV